MKVKLKIIIILIYVNCYSQTSIYNASDYNIIPDGNELNTKTIQKCLDLIEKNGGGTLYFPPGKYLSGGLTIGANITLFLDNGATLQASPKIEDYSGRHFILADKADNFSIKGNGTIDGNGTFFYDANYQPMARPEPWIVISKSNNVSIEGVNFINSPSHVLVFDRCNSVNVNNIKIINDPKSPNTDGIDIVASSNVFISNSHIDTGDDAICLKSKKDMDNAFAQNSILNRGIENVVVTNCILISDDAAIKLGTGSQNTTKNCVFTNSILKSRYGIALFMMDGGLYEDISFSNLQIETQARHDNHYPIFIDIHQRQKDSKVGTIKNIFFNNISIKTEGTVYVSGHPDQPLTDIYFNNINIIVPFARNTSKWVKPKGNKTIEQWATCSDFSNVPATFIIANANNLTLNNVSINHQGPTAMDRFAFWFENTSNLKQMEMSGNSINKSELIFVKN